jgi:hypothetical protein
MERNSQRWLALLAAMVLVSAEVVLGDDGAITGVGGRIRIMDEHPAVVLVAEHVHARVSVSDDIADVECVFVLANHGAADSVLIGFPESAGGDTGARPFLSFHSYVDGKAEPCSRVEGEGGNDPLFWWTKNVYFASGQTRIIRDEYRSPLGVGAGDSTGYYRIFEYTLWTGSSWSDSIGAASIVLTLNPCDGAGHPEFISPTPVEQGECEYRWHIYEADPGRGSSGSIVVGWRVPYADKERRSR